MERARFGMWRVGGTVFGTVVRIDTKQEKIIQLQIKKMELHCLNERQSQY